MKRIACFLTTLLFACGAYCQSASSPITVVDDFAFVSGQLPTNAAGQIVQGNIANLTTLTLNNLKAVLKTKGFKMNQVVKTMVYLTDMRDYDAMITAYTAAFVGPNRPAMDVIEVSNLPYRAAIQISCIANTSRIN